MGVWVRVCRVQVWGFVVRVLGFWFRIFRVYEVVGVRLFHPNNESKKLTSELNLVSQSKDVPVNKN